VNQTHTIEGRRLEYELSETDRLWHLSGDDYQNTERNDNQESSQKDDAEQKKGEEENGSVHGTREVDHSTNTNDVRVDYQNTEIHKNKNSAQELSQEDHGVTWKEVPKGASWKDAKTAANWQPWGSTMHFSFFRLEASCLGTAVST
jgi:hypothetical protein